MFADALGKTCHEFGYLIEVFQINHFHRRMHVAIGQADERTGNAATCPKDDIRIRAARGTYSFVLQRYLCGAGNFFNPPDNFRMIANPVSDGRAFSHFDVPMCGLDDAEIIRRMRNIDNQCHIRL